VDLLDMDGRKVGMVVVVVVLAVGAGQVLVVGRRDDGRWGAFDEGRRVNVVTSVGIALDSSIIACMVLGDKEIFGAQVWVDFRFGKRVLCGVWGV
jgi:hypothetical protein